MNLIIVQNNQMGGGIIMSKVNEITRESWIYTVLLCKIIINSNKKFNVIYNKLLFLIIKVKYNFIFFKITIYKF